MRIHQASNAGTDMRMKIALMLRSRVDM